MVAGKRLDERSAIVDPLHLSKRVRSDSIRGECDDVPILKTQSRDADVIRAWVLSA